MIPPPELLATAWLPFIVNFYWRVARLFFDRRFPSLFLISWFRTAEQNRTAGGDVESQHLFGLAVDLSVPLDQSQVLTEAGRALGLVAVNEHDHVHLQLFPRGALARAGVTFPS